MAGRNGRWLGSGMIASCGAGLLTSMMNPALAFGDTMDLNGTADPITIGLVMGGSDTPIPGTAYVDTMNSLFIAPHFPNTTYPGVLANGLFTPEGLSPLTVHEGGVKSLPLDISVKEGVTILDNNIQSNLGAGDITTVFGYSQSAIISSLEMEKLDPSGAPNDLPVQFSLIGDIMNPNGGIFERFDGLDLSALGINFYGATPADDFPTYIYTLEYDGYADFPRYPLDFLSDLNAFLGIDLIHGTYPDLSEAQLATATILPTSGPSETTYYMIPTTELPLLDYVRDIPVIGKPIADLLQPDLTYLVNLGYGDPLYGYSTSPANLATPIGLLPSLKDIEMMPGLLLSGTEEGIQNFVGDFTGSGPNPVTLLHLGVPTALLDFSPGTTSGTDVSSDPVSTLSSLVNDPASIVTDFVNAVNTLSSAASTAYSALLPTADIINGLLTSVPAFDITLFTDNISNPIDAIGLPFAADTGLLTLAGGIEFLVLFNTVTSIAGDLSSLIP
jgi:hypothetical protein